MQAHKKNFRPALRRRSSLTLFFMLLAVTLTACTQSISTPLPDLKRPEADGMLVAAQQKKAIEEMAQKRAEAEAQAVKQIEQSR